MLKKISGEFEKGNVFVAVGILHLISKHGLLEKLYNQGYFIKIFTSRFMGRSNENITLAKKRGLNITYRQLKKWGVKYHNLIFGKPSFDLYVDDKNLNFDKNWSLKILKILK